MKWFCATTTLVALISTAAIGHELNINPSKAFSVMGDNRTPDWRGLELYNGHSQSIQAWLCVGGQGRSKQAQGRRDSDSNSDKSGQLRRSAT